MGEGATPVGPDDATQIGGRPLSDTGPVQVGEQLGPYAIRREIGRGGMGVVFLAHDPRARRDVALKVLRDQGLATAEEVARFQLEAQAAARLEHPGIVPVYDVGTDGGRQYFAMRFVPGRSLDDLLNDEAVPPERAAAIVAQVAETLAYAHAQGVIHRDVKPANILLAEDGRALLTDFGLARDEQTTVRLSKTGEAMGTPAYMAPEQALGDKARIGPATDVYGLGATLYELLTHRPPFEGTTPYEVLHHVVRAEPVPPHKVTHSVPADLATICLKALQKDPAARYPSATELAADCRRFVAGQPILARPRSGWWHAWRFLVRHRAITAPVGAVAVAACVFALWWFTRPGALVLRVSPAGARVMVAGRTLVAGAAPLRVELPPGAYVVRAEAPEFVAGMREAQVERHAVRELALDLVRATGQLVVETEPRGDVILDGHRHGTPLRTALPTGPHRCWVEEAGHHRVLLDVTISARAAVRRRVTLVPARSWFHEGTHWNTHPPYGDVDGDGIADLFHFEAGHTLVTVAGATGAECYRGERDREIWTPFYPLDGDGDGLVECVTLERDAGVWRLRGVRPADGTVAWESPPVDPVVLDELADGHTGDSQGTVPVFGCPGDLDGDGRTDAVVLERPATLQAFGSTGRPLWRHPLPAATDRWLPAGDVDGDGVRELLVWWSAGIRCLDGRTGALRWHHARAATPAAPVFALPAQGIVGWTEGDAYVVLDQATGAERLRRAGAAPAVGPGTWSLVLRMGDGRDARRPYWLGSAPDGACRCWDLCTGALRWRRAGHAGTTGARGALLLGDVDVPDGPLVAAVFDGDGRTVHLCDPDDGAERWQATFADPVSVVNGPWVLAPGGPPLIAVAAGADWRWVDLRSGVEHRRGQAPGAITCVGPVADFDRDGRPELFYGTRGGHVIALGADGSERFGALIEHAVTHLDVLDLDADGWQDALVQSSQGAVAVRANRIWWRLELGDDARAAPQTYDVNGDGTPDVIAFVLLRGEGSQQLAAIDGRDGTLLWVHPAHLDGFRPPLLLDWDGDGVPEVCHWLPGMTHALLVVDIRTGAERARVADLGTWGYAEPAGGDLDGDGRPEVVCNGWYDHGRTVAVSAASGAVRWSHADRGFAWSGFVIARAGGDQADVFGTNYGSAGGFVRRLDGRTGRPRWSNAAAGGGRAGVAVGPLGAAGRWSVVVNGADGALRFLDAATGEPWQTLAGGGGTAARPVIVDVDGDGANEVVIGYRGGFACVDARGAVRWRAGARAVTADPVIADLEGDGEREVVVGDMGGTVWVCDLRTGVRRWAWTAVPERARPIEAAVAVADFDGDGIQDVCFAGTDDALTCLRGRGRMPTVR